MEDAPEQAMPGSAEMPMMDPEKKKDGEEEPMDDNQDNAMEMRDGLH